MDNVINEDDMMSDDEEDNYSMIANTSSKSADAGQEEPESYSLNAIPNVQSPTLMINDHDMMSNDEEDIDVKGFYS